MSFVSPAVVRSSALSLSFCSLYCARRDLPSFPTRRSSDLSVPFQLSVQSHRAGKRGRKRERRDARLRTPRDISSRQLQRSRSEEHTSELQSRGHLVCRLLLEKNKTGIKSLSSTSRLTFHHF